MGVYIGIGCQYIWQRAAGQTQAIWREKQSKARRHSGYLGFGTVSSLKSGIQNSVCPTLPKILQIHSAGQQLYCDKVYIVKLDPLFHPCFFFFESTFSTGGIKVFLIEQKFTKSFTAQLNIENPSSNQSSCLFLVTQLCSQAAVHQLNCPRLGAMDGGRDAGRFFFNC